MTIFRPKLLMSKPTKSAVDDGTKLPQKPRFEDSTCRVLSAAGGTPHWPKKSATILLSCLKKSALIPCKSMSKKSSVNLCPSVAYSIICEATFLKKSQNRKNFSNLRTLYSTITYLFSVFSASSAANIFFDSNAYLRPIIERRNASRCCFLKI
jgi:hypothetical protein